MGDKESDKVVQGMGTGAPPPCGLALGAAVWRCLGVPSTVMHARRSDPPPKKNNTAPKHPAVTVPSACTPPLGAPRPTSGCSPPSTPRPSPPRRPWESTPFCSASN